MSYGQLSKEKLEAIQEVVEGIQKLEPGKHLVVSHEEPEQLQRIRLWIYEWLFNEGLKREFKVKFLEATKIAVIRKGQVGAVPEVERPLEKRVDEVIQQLLDKEAPTQELVEMFREGKVTALEFEKIGRELRRILE